MKKLFFISPKLSKFIYADVYSHNLNTINMGVQLFLRNSSKFGSNSECIFRISQDGILNVIPYMTKRLIYTEKEDEFKQFLLGKNIDIDEIKGQKVKEEISNLTTGCFVLALKIGDNVEALTMHKFQRAVTMMVSKEGVINLHLRYLSKEEREKCADIFELNK